MYILIHRDTMEVLCKHNVMFVLANISWLYSRSQDLEVDIFVPDNIQKFAVYTDTQLKKLIGNLTQLPIPENRTELKQLACVLCNDLIPDDIDFFESEVQAAFVLETDKNSYRYVKGAKVPEKITS